MKKLIILVLLSILLPGCEDGYIPPFSSPPPQIPAPPVTSPDSSLPGPSNNQEVPSEQYREWYGSYSLPESWQISRENPNKARKEGSGKQVSYLEISNLGPTVDHSRLRQMAESARDALAPCQPGQSDGVGQNCSLPAFISESKIAGEDVVLFRYYGTWMDRGQEVNEIFLNHHGYVIHLFLQGGFSENLADLEMLVSSLNWSLEIPPAHTELEPEEKGL